MSRPFDSWSTLIISQINVRIQCHYELPTDGHDDKTPDDDLDNGLYHEVGVGNRRRERGTLRKLGGGRCRREGRERRERLNGSQRNWQVSLLISSDCTAYPQTSSTPCGSLSLGQDKSSARVDFLENCRHETPLSSLNTKRILTTHDVGRLGVYDMDGNEGLNGESNHYGAFSTERSFGGRSNVTQCW